MDSWLGTKEFCLPHRGLLPHFGRWQLGEVKTTESICQSVLFFHQAFIRFAFNQTSKANLHNRVGLAEPAEPNAFQ